MERVLYIWEFKDTEFKLENLHRFIGSNVCQAEAGSILRVVCRTATRDAKRAANAESARGKIKIIIEEDKN